MTHCDITVRGNVHGVGYRYSACEKARELHLSGFVRNEADGAVYIEVEGPEAAVTQFVEWCRHGSHSARVESLQVRSRDNIEGYSNFVIL
ncbi:MAG: acylphosphatase [Patescibacteria group bacterium]